LNGWFFLTLVLAILDWFFVYQGLIKFNYFTKPATLLALIAWFSSLGGWQIGLYWFGMALVFSLLGDVILLLPEKYFTYGLGAFLLAQICYIVGFNPAAPLDGLPILVIGGGVLLIASYLFNIVRKAIESNAKNKKMETPLLVYSLALSLMLFSTLLTLVQSNWLTAAAGLVAAGGILFFSSDSLLAYNRFVQAIPNAKFFVRIGYHLGQMALISGVLLNFTHR
jgi:uncharacterized membrane protein YhhN